jgi:hypothetical protein
MRLHLESKDSGMRFCDFDKKIDIFGKPIETGFELAEV